MTEGSIMTWAYCGGKVVSGGGDIGVLTPSEEGGVLLCGICLLEQNNCGCADEDGEG